ncbi:hypothetical protein DEDE109153_09170 [Deinococcus deserti]|uniref:hypothetical protein n=1 Tax=Deinococcus deserti TaxID=310783 RepID=UPI000307437F|nr:hypothetical protein [Deinococcus deserti]
MDANQARFLLEVQRVSARVAAECSYTPTPSRQPTVRSISVRHAIAVWLRHLASRVDVPSAPLPV